MMYQNNLISKILKYRKCDDNYVLKPDSNLVLKQSDIDFLTEKSDDHSYIHYIFFGSILILSLLITGLK
jgi:hypothetical protein